MILPEEKLLEFAALAELGVSADGYCFATCIPRADLEAACQRQWRMPADAVAAKLRVEPARLLARCLLASSMDNRMLVRLLDYREQIKSGPAPNALPSLTDDELLAKARAQVRIVR